MNVYRILMIFLSFAVLIPEVIFQWKLRTGKDPLRIGKPTRSKSTALILLSLGTGWRFWNNPAAGATSTGTEQVVFLLIAIWAAFSCWWSLYTFFRIRKPVEKP